MSSKNVVIIGAGAGGGIVSSRLLKLIPEDNVNITVIDKTGRTDFQPSYMLVAVGNKRPDQISIDINRMTSKNLNPIKAEVTEVDPENRYVNTTAGKFNYDILVISPGAKINRANLRGNEDIYHFWELEEALKLQTVLGSIKKGKIVISTAGLIYKCPPVPWEMAMLLDEYFRGKGIRDQVQIEVAHAVSRPFEMFGPSIWEPLEQWLREANIDGTYKFALSHIDPEKKLLISTTNETIKYDYAIVAPPHEPPEFIKNNDILKDNNTGWADSNLHNFRNRKYDDIYAIGDVIAPSVGLGMAGVFAHFQADTIASYIAADIYGSYVTVPYNPIAVCVMEGGAYGWSAYCDFAKKLKNPQLPYPDCRMIGRGRLYKLGHTIYEKYFLASIYRGRV